MLDIFIRCSKMYRFNNEQCIHCKGQNEKMMACLICLLTRWTSYVDIWGFASRREIMLDTQRHFTEMGKWHVESGSAWQMSWKIFVNKVINILCRMNQTLCNSHFSGSPCSLLTSSQLWIWWQSVDCCSLTPAAVWRRESPETGCAPWQHILRPSDQRGDLLSSEICPE